MLRHLTVSKDEAETAPSVMMKNVDREEARKAAPPEGREGGPRGERGDRGGDRGDRGGDRGGAPDRPAPDRQPDTART